jgi:glycine betaine/choline ABC-type transport system substrate-binding protein
LFTENGHWVWVSDSTYTWDFDIVRVTNDDTIRVHKSIPAKYHIKGIAPYEKIVKSFSYQFGMSNGWAYGSGATTASIW